MDIEFQQQVRKAMAGGAVPSRDARALLAQSGLPVAQFMLTLIPLAQGFASPVLSGFAVGAVGRGESGALYFGANFEYAGCALAQTVHAEQAVVVNAAVHGEKALTMLAVSAPPCGHCRQFLSELVRADALQILLPDRAPALLSDYLPSAFGPADLGVSTRMLMPQQAALEWVVLPGTDAASARAAFNAATVSYAPYSGSPAGVGLTLADGRTVAGSYLENAAFNPSVAPLQAALVAAAFAGQSIDVVASSLVQLEQSSIDHAAGAQLLLRQCAPGVSLEVIEVRRVFQKGHP